MRLVAVFFPLHAALYCIGGCRDRTMHCIGGCAMQCNGGYRDVCLHSHWPNMAADNMYIADVDGDDDDKRVLVKLMSSCCC